jgi:hypothetical protein
MTVPSDPDRVRQGLGETRRLTVALSLTSGAVGLVPLPVLGDLGIRLVRSFLLLQLAKRRGIALTREEAMVIAGGVGESSPSRIAALGALAVGLRMAWRRLTRTVLVLLRFDDVGRSFLLGTYFDYYLLAFRGDDAESTLSLKEVEQVRRAINDACSTARQHLVSAMFRKSVSDLVRAGTYVPKTLWQMAASAMEQRDEDQLEEVLDEEIDSFLRRVTQRVEQELSATGQVTLDALCLAFDKAWEGPTTETNQPRTADDQERRDESDDT